MSETIARKVSRFRERVNSFFYLGFKKKLIKENERGIANLEQNCLTEKDFVLQIGTLAILVDDFDEDVLRSCLKRKYKCSGSLNLLEKFLEENGLEKTNLIKKLRYIKRIRNTIFPTHRGASSEFFELMRELDFKFPFDWNNVWKTCLTMYINSLAELQDQLYELTARKQYQRGIEKHRIKMSEKHGNVIYLNDILYKYRVLLPVDYKHKMSLLVDYMTAAAIAYDRNLKSINYALRRYVVPLKDKFREHTEDIYFVQKRRFITNELLRTYNILLARDDIGVEDEEAFKKYFMCVYASVVAYQMGITPDWLVKHYWGSL